MDEFDCLFQIDSHYRVQICRQCQYAIVPSQTRTHLQKHHQRFSREHRNAVAQRCEAITELARRAEDVIYPVSTDAAIASLPIYFDGIKCQAIDQGQTCAYICVQHAASVSTVT